MFFSDGDASRIAFSETLPQEQTWEERIILSPINCVCGCLNNGEIKNGVLKTEMLKC